MNAEAQLTKGKEAVAAGEKCLKKFSFFDKMAKFEDATECFVTAAKSFQMAKAWEEAGTNFARAAEMYAEKLKTDHEAASNYQKAAECYSKVREGRWSEGGGGRERCEDRRVVSSHGITTIVRLEPRACAGGPIAAQTAPPTPRAEDRRPSRRTLEHCRLAASLRVVSSAAPIVPSRVYVAVG
jgi:hypothetical protein